MARKHDVSTLLTSRKYQATLLSMTLLISPMLVQAAAAQSIGATTALAPLTGRLAPGQSSVGVYGTDLGYSFKHNGSIRFLFGDTWSAGDGTPIDPNSDDSQGA